ncbi:MAG TPA: ATP-binding protein [Syntrophorhabdales bacterium]|nr:ATP-binding protein [Syntrophorhabdales bacterium]
MDPVNVLGKVIEISHSNLEVASRIEAILNLMAHEMGLEEALLYTLDKDKRLSCRFMNRTSRLYEILSSYRCHVGEGIVGSVAQKRVPQYFTDRNVPPRFGCLFYADLDEETSIYKSFAFLPLSDDSFVYGVLLLCSSGIGTPLDTEKIVLSIIARELGGILRTYDLLVSSKKRISELATLSELGRVLTSATEPHLLLQNIASITAKSFNAAFTTIKLSHSFVRLDLQRFTSGEIDANLEGVLRELETEALRLKRASSLSDHTPESTLNATRFSLHCTPILSKDRALGTITLCRKGEHQLEEDDQYLVSAVANYISSGLETSFLNTKLRDVLKELGDAQKRVIEHEKLRSLGEMTASIAHEIRNPLVIIGGFTKRLAKQVQLDEKDNRYIDIIIGEVSRLEAILNDVLNYVKDASLLLESCNLNSIIDEILYLLASDKIWERVRVVKTYDPDLPTIVCDIHQIKQVLINIILNAFQAMGAGGTLALKTERRLYQDRPSVAVSIADTGGGIDPSLLDNIFNPFFTTKERGTGLGLAISNKIVMHHNGHIEVRNRTGEGATFIVHLPINNKTTGAREGIT